MHNIEIGEGPENLSTNLKWSRPALHKIDPKENSITFQQIDLDFYEGMVSDSNLCLNQIIDM
jgi:hypothetical protein